MAKKKEPIIINKEELMPTNLGSFKQKETGIILTVGIIIVFVLGIIFLPQIMDMVDPVNNAPIPYVPIDDNPTNPDNPDDTPEDKVVVYELKEGLEIDEQGYTFHDFVLNTTPGTFSFVLTNHTGAANFFKNHSYYIEYYSESEELLGRTKMDVDGTSTSVKQEYSISNVTKVGLVTKISVREIDVEEYPAVKLTVNADKVPYLECSSQNHTITYFFNQTSSKYALKQIEDSFVMDNSMDSYEASLTRYTNLSNSLKNVDGIEVSLIPTVDGFEFIQEVFLDQISETNRKNYLKDFYYYPVDTDARVISFELQAQDYICR